MGCLDKTWWIMMSFILCTLLIVYASISVALFAIALLLVMIISPILASKADERVSMEQEIIINRSPVEVLDFVVQPSCWKRNYPFTVGITGASSPISVGDHLAEKAFVQGIIMTGLDWIVTEYVPGKSFTIELVKTKWVSGWIPGFVRK